MAGARVHRRGLRVWLRLARVQEVSARCVNTEHGESHFIPVTTCHDKQTQNIKKAHNAKNNRHPSLLSALPSTAGAGRAIGCETFLGTPTFASLNATCWQRLHPLPPMPPPPPVPLHRHPRQTTTATATETAAASAATVGQCKLNSVDPWLEKCTVSKGYRI